MIYLRLYLRLSLRPIPLAPLKPELVALQRLRTFSSFARYSQSSIQVLSKQEVLATGVAIGAPSRTDPVVVDENPPHLTVNLQQARHQGCRVVWASPNKHGSRPNRCRLAVLAPGASPGSLGRCRPAVTVPGGTHGRLATV